MRCSKPNSEASPFEQSPGEISIHRNTAKKYAEAKSLPMKRVSVGSHGPQPDNIAAD